MKLYYIKRFQQQLSIYLGDNVPIYKFIYYLVDYMVSYIFTGSSIFDYFAYGFYKLRLSGRKEWITYRRHKKIQLLFNSEKHIDVLRNKSKFNKRYSDLLGRNWLDVNKCTYHEFETFVKSNEAIFVKDVNGLCGIGTSKQIISEIENIKGFYESLVQRNGSYYILEEPCSQISELKEFHPWSVNTIRIVTLRTGSETRIMSATFRMGNNKKNIDNLHANGIAAHIDIQSGVIFMPGFDKENNTYISHPITKKQIVGYKIPYWEECKRFAVEAAARIPEVGYIGWDVVLQDNGQCILIEGNDNADHDVQQLHYKGLWADYQKYLKH